MYDEIEAVLNPYVRPLLATHGGNMEVISFEDGIVRFRLTGQCAGCAAADLTSEELINEELVNRIPAVKQAVMVTDVSPELISQAREMLRRRHA